MTLDFQIQQQLRSELDSGESIVWQAKASARLLTAKSFVPLIFAVTWLSIVGTSLFTQTHGRHGWPPVMMFPFGVFGLVFVALPLFQFLAARQTYYLITNRRVLFITLGRTKKVVSYYPDKLQSLERRERSNNRGDIVIDRIAANGNYRANYYAPQEIGFMNIPDVKKVEGLLRDLATKGRSQANR